MHCLALRIGAEPRHRYTDPGLLAKPCTLVHLRSRSRYTIQTACSLQQEALYSFAASACMVCELYCICWAVWSPQLKDANHVTALLGTAQCVCNGQPGMPSWFNNYAAHLQEPLHWYVRNLYQPRLQNSILT